MSNLGYKAPPARTRLRREHIRAIEKRLEAGARKRCTEVHRFTFDGHADAVQIGRATIEVGEDWRDERQRSFTWLAGDIIELPPPLEAVSKHLEKVRMKLERDDDVLALCRVFRQLYRADVLVDGDDLAKVTDAEALAAGDVAGRALAGTALEAWRPAHIEGDEVVFFVGARGLGPDHRQSGLYEVRVHRVDYGVEAVRVGDKPERAGYLIG